MAKAKKAAQKKAPAKAKPAKAVQQAVVRGSSAAPRVIRVRAKRLGYYQHERRREGDVFDFSMEHANRDGSLPSWIEPVDRRTPKKTTTPNEALKNQHDEVMRERSAQGTIGQEGADTVTDTGANPLGEDD